MGSRLNRVLRGAYLDVWEAFVREMKGSWNDPGPGTNARMEIPHARGPIVIQADVAMIMVGKVLVPVLSTLFTAHLPTDQARRFSVSRATFAASVAEWFGRLDVQVDHGPFDDAFVLKAQTPDFLRTIFADGALRDRFLADFEGSLSLRDDSVFFSDPTPGIDPLELTISGYVDDADRLRRLYAMFAATLDRVVAVSGA